MRWHGWLGQRGRQRRRGRLFEAAGRRCDDQPTSLGDCGLTPCRWPFGFRLIPTLRRKKVSRASSLTASAGIWANRPIRHRPGYARVKAEAVVCRRGRRASPDRPLHQNKAEPGSSRPALKVRSRNGAHKTWRNALFLFLFCSTLPA